MDAQVQGLQQELQQQQLLQQRAAHMAALVQAQQQQDTPGPFALTPAQAQQNIVELSTLTRVKPYKQIVTPLTTLFDGSATKLVTLFPLFLIKLRQVVGTLLHSK